MAARRPRTQPNPPTVDEKAAAAVKTALLVDEARAEVAEHGPRFFYASVRLKRTAGKLRHGTSALLVEASPDQTIEFRKEPYEHFLVMPGGTEIPLGNTAGAVAIGSEIASKMSRAERLAKRAKSLEEKMGVRAEEKAARASDDDDDEPTPKPKPKITKRKGVEVQEVPVEDDDLDDSLDESELDDAVEGEDGQE